MWSLIAWGICTGLSRATRIDWAGPLTTDPGHCRLWDPMFHTWCARPAGHRGFHEDPLGACRWSTDPTPPPDDGGVRIIPAPAPAPTPGGGQ